MDSDSDSDIYTEITAQMSQELEKAGITALTFQQLREMTDDFSKERIVGVGGIGVFYKGVDTNGQEIAVKIFKQFSLNYENMVFRNELTNTMRVEHHQNIVKPVAYCFDVVRRPVEFNGITVIADDIHRAICYPYAHNGSLQMHISDESSGLDWPTRYRIIKGTCEGLKHLHHHGPAHVLHLNITPDKILLDYNMEPKLGGFGLSKFYDKSFKKENSFLDEDEAITDERYGTHGYVPPEYIEMGIISKKSDIFSLGVTMIRIATGLEEYRRYLDMPSNEFIDKVRANWRRILQSTFRGSTLDAYCEQVTTCIKIALCCLEGDRHRRPDIADITRRLSATETYKGFEYIQVWKMSFHDIQEITNDFKEKIGKGASSIVYKGKLANGESVAVKRLNNDLANHMKQFESEKHLKNIEHENIVRLVGFCHETRRVPVADDRNPGKYTLADITEFVLCYELLSKGSLEDKMRTDEFSRLDWQTRYSVIQGICKGLHYLHQECHNAPIVHRDLKPSNVLLDDNMIPKLGDFGLSRIVPKTKPHLTMAVGSRGYMAPETTRDIRSSKITPKSDIYSLGVLILEIVTGEKCPDDDEYGRHYIEKVREARKQNSFVASRYPSLENRFLQQVKNWISIGLCCAEELPERRPTIEHIMHFLETEYSNSVNMHEGKVSKISFKEMNDITNKLSVRYGESIFGAVYKGTRVNGDDIIVIILKQQMILSPDQFEGEVNRMSFKHNNILQLKGYSEEIHAGEVRERFLCYEFFQGRLGESLIQLDWEARYRIIKGICQALKYLHEECGDGPQVHMGLSPTNIWLDDEMVPKLGACGLSRLFGKDQTQIYNKEIVESRGYVAPEHVELTKMTTESDIYSLGVLIIEIVTGQMCPSSDNGSVGSFIANVHKTWMKDSHVANKYPSLDAECRQQLKGCIKIGVQCAEIRPDKRPTAGEIIHMLEKECISKPGFWNALCPGACAKA